MKVSHSFHDTDSCLSTDVTSCVFWDSDNQLATDITSHSFHVSDDQLSTDLTSHRFHVSDDQLATGITSQSSHGSNDQLATNITSHVFHDGDSQQATGFIFHDSYNQAAPIVTSHDFHESDNQNAGGSHGPEVSVPNSASSDMAETLSPDIAVVVPCFNLSFLHQRRMLSAEELQKESDAVAKAQMKAKLQQDIINCHKDSILTRTGPNQQSWGVCSCW